MRSKLPFARDLFVDSLGEQSNTQRQSLAIVALGSGKETTLP